MSVSISEGKGGLLCPRALWEHSPVIDPKAKSPQRSSSSTYVKPQRRQQQTEMAQGLQTQWSVLGPNCMSVPQRQPFLHRHVSMWPRSHRASLYLALQEYCGSNMELD
jgi:hypothetical protein